MRFDPDTFVKTAPASAFDMFAAEAEGLAELAAANEVRVPDVISCGVADGQAHIALEKLQLEAATPKIERVLGEQLAALHRHTAMQFGWRRNNTIGPTPQINNLSENWIEFFRRHRLEYQLQLAARNGYSDELQSMGAQVGGLLDSLFEGYDPAPSLLHGDLWGGNWGAVDGAPVIFDPAVYYGDRETDIAMTKLFGGFGPAFYDSYTSAWPLAAGHERRSDLYQLYHVLNHLNLFGTGYLRQATDLMRSLLRFSV